GIHYKTAHAETPAVCHYTRLIGSKDEKLAQLNHVQSFGDLDWRDCPSAWNEVFLPASNVAYGTWPKLTHLFPWQYSGVQFKRTWPIGETKELLERRWATLLKLNGPEQQSAFKETTARTVTKSCKDFATDQKLPTIAGLKPDTAPARIVRYGFRSFDRQWAIADDRVCDRPRRPLWKSCGEFQVFLTSLLTDVLGYGPAASVSSFVPDLHHFRGSFGGKDV